MQEVGGMIADVLQQPGDEVVKARISEQVRSLTSRFSLPGLGFGSIEPDFGGSH